MAFSSTGNRKIVLEFAGNSTYNDEVVQEWTIFQSK